MAMTLSFHENFDYAETTSNPVEAAGPAGGFSPAGQEKFHFFAEKMHVPKFRSLVSRPRLARILDKSAAQFGAALITGRAGTGKTALASDYAQKYERAAWFSVEAADCDWMVFSRYFMETLGRAGADFEKPRLESLRGEVGPFVESVFEQAESGNFAERSFLIVLDDIHHVFDTEWFTDFFYTLVYCLPKNINLLLLSRTKPPLPLWRLRSKQVLGTIDEKLLAFTLEETIKLFEKAGYPARHAEPAFRESYGRVSKLRQIGEALRGL
jgi:LuxR family maltose regulon positive regulatory protein